MSFLLISEGMAFLHSILPFFLMRIPAANQEQSGVYKRNLPQIPGNYF